MDKSHIFYESLTDISQTPMGVVSFKNIGYENVISVEKTLFFLDGLQKIPAIMASKHPKLGLVKTRLTSEIRLKNVDGICILFMALFFRFFYLRAARAI